MLGQIDPNKPRDLISFHIGQKFVVTDPEHPSHNRVGEVFKLTLTGILAKDNRDNLIELRRDQITHFGEMQLW